MTKRTQIKLSFYEIEGKDITIDSFTAKELDDFIILKVETKGLNEEERQATIEQLNEVVSKNEHSKTYVILDDSVDLWAYGVREEIEDDN